MESVCEYPQPTVDDKRFVGKTVVITGAGGQFGRTGCLYFARRGCRVAALDVVDKALQETYNEMEKEFGKGNFDFKAWTCDVTDADSVKNAISQVVGRFRNIHYLWNNAGYQGAFAKSIEYDPKDFSRVMEINVTGQFIVMQAVAQQMRKQEGTGWSIVNTASVAGLHCTPAMIAYSASKSASISLTITAAKDFAEYGIRVNAISPALIGPGKSVSVYPTREFPNLTFYTTRIHVGPSK
jgi:NAD(P)-dependent dehydrogenase (short-subunit alcohol dehydrogenase family)